MSLRINLEIGHEASLRTKRTPEGFTHDWKIFVRGCDGADIHYYVEKVVFYLHETFPKPKRVIKEPPYSLKESGYAGFNLPIDIYLRNAGEQKKIKFNYDLHLQTTGPPISRVQKEKYVFNSPPEDFRQKLLKGGAVACSPTANNAQEVVENRLLNEEKNQLMSKPKLGGSEPPKKHKIEPHISASNSFQDLFGTPITKTKIPETPKPPPPIKDPKNNIKSDKSNDKPKSKHSPHKDKDKDKERDKTDKKPRDEKRSKDKNRDRDRSKEKSSKKEKSPRPKSPSPKRSPPRQSSPSPAPPTSKHKDKETPRTEKDKKEKSDEKKSKKDKKDKEHSRDKDKHRDNRKDEKKESKSKESAKDKDPTPPPAVAQSPVVTQSKAEKKEKSKEDDRSEKTKPEKTDKLDKTDDKPKHKHKKKDKDRKEKKEEKSHKSSKKVEKPLVTAPVVASAAATTPVTSTPAATLNGKDTVVAATTVDRSNLFGSPKSDPPAEISPIKDKTAKPLNKLFTKMIDSSSDSSSNSREPSPVPVEPKKKEKVKKKERKNDKDPEKKRKRKASPEPEQPPEKVNKEEDSLNNNSDSDNKTKEVVAEKNDAEDYMGVLRELQHKIMGLKESAALQKVVQLIAETGQYEISAHTFDFDLCLLDRSTVRQLQDFLATTS